MCFTLDTATVEHLAVTSGMGEAMAGAGSPVAVPVTVISAWKVWGHNTVRTRGS
jgi:hypothetical protein